MRLQVIQDTREKVGKFTFQSYDDVDVIRTCLRTGDYSLVGFEDKITLDRKKGSNELQMCLGKDWTRFKKELDRMVLFEESYIICEFPEYYIDIFPKMSGIPPKRWKRLMVRGPFIRKRLHEIREEYPSIKIIFCEDHYAAEQQTYNILKEYHDNQINSES